MAQHRKVAFDIVPQAARASAFPNGLPTTFSIATANLDAAGLQTAVRDKISSSSSSAHLYIVTHDAEFGVDSLEDIGTATIAAGNDTIRVRVVELPAATVTGVAEDLEISQALSAMRNSTPLRDMMSPGTVRLPEGIMLPGDAEGRNALYVRTCYALLFKKILRHGRVLLTGTPGIGKTWSGLYIMWRLQQEEQRPDIVWETDLRPNKRILLKDGKAYVGSLSDFSKELANPNTWTKAWAQEQEQAWAQVASRAHLQAPQLGCP